MNGYKKTIQERNTMKKIKLDKENLLRNEIKSYSVVKLRQILFKQYLLLCSDQIFDLLLCLDQVLDLRNSLVNGQTDRQK
jgi:hypothetical protein